MKKLERLKHKLRWHSIRNLYHRMVWRLFRSYYRVNKRPFMTSHDLSFRAVTDNKITFKKGMPWGRYHPSLPWQYFGDDSVVMFNDFIFLMVNDNYNPITHNNNIYIPDLSTGSVYSDQEFLYGEFEIECRLPDKGQWPAFWLLGDHSWPPEIDIFEFIPPENTSEGKRLLSSTIHYGTEEDRIEDGSAIRVKDPIGRSYFGFKWTPKSMEWFYNGKPYLKLNNPELMSKYFNKPMRIILGTGVTGYDYDLEVLNSMFTVYNVTYKKL